MLQRTLLILALISSPLYAQEEAKPVEPPPPPPPPEVFEGQDEIQADVTIRRDEEKVIEEYRINGQLYMVRVIPTRGKPYYIRYPEGEQGRVIRRELDDIQTPFWKLFEW